MISWFPYSIAATLLLGLSMVFYKFPSAKNVNRYGVVFWSLLIGEMLSLFFFANYLTAQDTKILFWAILWGASFAALSLLQMYALNHVDTGTLFPITSTLSLVLTISFGFIFFSHNVRFLQITGIVSAIVAVFLFLYKKGKLEYSRHIIIIGLTITCLSAFNKIIQKIVADGFDIRAFQIYQYLFAAVFALLVYFVSQKSLKISGLFERKQLALGGLIGVLGFFGAYALLIALTKGPFALVFSVQSTYIFVVAVAGYFLFQEKFTYRKVVALILAVLAVVLIRIG